MNKFSVTWHDFWCKYTYTIHARNRQLMHEIFHTEQGLR